MLVFNIVILQRWLLYPYSEVDGLMNDLYYCNEVGDQYLDEETFFYRQKILDSKTCQQVADIIYKDNAIFPQYYTPFYIANKNRFKFEKKGIQFDDAFGYIHSMFDFDLIYFTNYKPDFDELTQPLPYQDKIKVLTRFNTD